ncbi:MAG: fructose-6-phosphate aldolase [Planctomycetota bacterium]
MQLYADTADIEEIRKLADIGIIDGVTTNPSLLKKVGLDRDEAIATITDLVPGPVSSEVIATDAAGMIAEGLEAAKVADNVVIKIPTTPDGLKACKALSEEGIKVNMTLVFSSMQALMVAKAGAAYVSPFVGRLDDIHMVGMGVIDEITAIYSNYDYDCEIIVASVRSVLHVQEAAVMGADICTCPPKVLWQMMKHPLTDIGLAKFLADAGK